MKASSECVNIRVDAHDQYLEMAKAFERRGDRDIFPESMAQQDAEDYEKDVLRILDKQLAPSGTGRALMDAIRAARPRTILIKPVDELDKETWCLRTPFVKGFNPVSGHEVTAATGGFAVDCQIEFTPDTLDREDKADPGMRVDEVLLHELVHGLRRLVGRQGITPIDSIWDSDEEFVAVLVANIYSSEIGRPLREGHIGLGWGSVCKPAITSRLPKSLEDPKQFLAYKNFRSLVQQFVNTHPTLASGLRSLVKVKFNPIAAL
jgi:hypothetical protein